MNLFIDLDGTLINSRPRVYLLFQQLVPESSINYESYWGMKRAGISNESILSSKFGYGTAAIQAFVTKWMQRIESPEFLDIDQVFDGIHDALDRLGSKASLHVCTARQHSRAAVLQLERLDLLRFFTTVMVTEQKQTKQDMIARVDDLHSQDWILGDTGSDMLVGQQLGIRSCAVLSGFLDEERLRRYGPDLIVPNVVDFQP